jgi:hypothetical protein
MGHHDANWGETKAPAGSLQRGPVNYQLILLGAAANLDQAAGAATAAVIG